MYRLPQADFENAKCNEKLATGAGYAVDKEFFI
jgi:hypothetical protein